MTPVATPRHDPAAEPMPINHHGLGRCFPQPVDAASLADHLETVHYRDPELMLPAGRRVHARSEQLRRAKQHWEKKRVRKARHEMLHRLRTPTAPRDDTEANHP